VPKIAQLVEARIHAWLDERCVEPKVQQIVLPGLWPRKKNTRGGEEDDENDEEAIIEDEEGDIETDRERETQNTAEPRILRDLTNDGSLESRMAEEGKKLLASESRLSQESTRGQASDGVRRRNQTLRRNESTENIRIPGQFD
jgi:maintenance of morphology protein 1